MTTVRRSFRPKSRSTTVDALGGENIEDRLNLARGEIERLLADLRVGFQTDDAANPVQLLNRDWWAAVTLCATLLAKIYTFHDGEMELLRKLEERVRLLERTVRQ